jgi:hypothetical protein
MILTMRADPDVATLPRRALSTVVDGAIMLVVEQLAQAGSKRLTRPLIQHVFQSSRERNEAARLRIDEMRRAHGGDAERVQEETMRIYREENVSCIPALLTTLGTACLHLVPALLSPRRQTLIERLAGTVVVKEPRR